MPSLQGVRERPLPDRGTEPDKEQRICMPPEQLARQNAPHHTPQFDIDEDALALGTAATLAYTTAHLAHGFEA